MLVDLTATLETLRTVRQRLDVVEVDLVSRLLSESDHPESVVQAVFDVPPRQARRVVARAATLGVDSAAPQLLAALFRAGEVSLGHVDAFVSATEALEPEVRRSFLADTTAVSVAATLSVRRFADRLRVIAQKCRRQQGLDLLARQRKEVRARTWVDRATGMWHISGAFDPQTAVHLSARLEAAMNEILSAGLPDTCPSDPFERLDHIRGLALAAMLQGAGASARGRAELVVVVDTTARDEFGEPRIDWGLPVDLPLAALVEFFQQKPGVAVVDVARNGKLIDRTEQLDLGRSTRLANRVQRRLLRGLHESCAVPGCAAPFHRCDIHHVVWWRHGGTTDMANLAPVCPNHHRRIHEEGWVLTLDERRVITVRCPDGQIMTTGPPPGSETRAA